MGWTLVVSEDEGFQREAISRATGAIVGATGDSSARSLVRAIDVERILIDATGDVGRRFLRVLRCLPSNALPAIDVLVISPDSTIPGFSSHPSLDAAMTQRRTVAA